MISIISERLPIVVTGATGFIGGHVVELLCKTGYQVIAPVRDMEIAKKLEHLKKAMVVHINSLHDIDKIPNASILIHCAWGDVANIHSENHLAIHLPDQYLMMQRIFEEEKFKKVIILGTCFEYGKQYGPMSPEAPVAPNTPYAQAKHQLHMKLRELQKKYFVDLIWARVFYTYGPRQPEKTLISQFDRALEFGDEVFNMSFGEQLLDYLPVEEVAQKILLLMTKKNGVYNICSGKPKSVRRMLEERMMEKNKNIRLNLGYFSYREEDSLAIWGQEAS